jgi:hypothetical protein
MPTVNSDFSYAQSFLTVIKKKENSEKSDFYVAEIMPQSPVD